MGRPLWPPKAAHSLVSSKLRLRTLRSLGKTESYPGCQMNFPNQRPRSQPESVLWHWAHELNHKSSPFHKAGFTSFSTCSSTLQLPPGRMQTFIRTLAQVGTCRAAHCAVPGLLSAGHITPIQQSATSGQNLDVSINGHDIFVSAGPFIHNSDSQRLY